MSYGWTGHTPLPETTKRHIRHRDNNTCQHCGDTAHHVDHITPLAEGGTHHPTNLQTLCAICHNTKTRQETNRGHQRRTARGKHPTEPHPGIL